MQPSYYLSEVCGLEKECIQWIHPKSILNSVFQFIAS